MENIKNKIPNHIQSFFKSLSEYLDTKLYYFGSIQRADYFPGLSDIDVDIFTENMQETIVRLQHFLHVPRSDFKKFAWRLNSTNKMAFGYKVMFHNEFENYSVEFSLHEQKMKEAVLGEHNAKSVLPFYASWMLILLKYLYYNLGWIDKKTFRQWKKNVLTIGIGFPEDQFVVLDPKK
jgi:hypothetical protein